jgi:hypothetical protein
MSCTPPLVPHPVRPSPPLDPFEPLVNPFEPLVMQKEPGPFEEFSLDEFPAQQPSSERATRAVYAQEFAQELPEGIPARKHLLELSGYAIQQVEQDAHSLFRSIAHLLMEERFLEALTLQIARLQSLLSPIPARGYLIRDFVCQARFQQKIPVGLSERIDLAGLLAQALEGLKKGKSPLELLADPVFSEKWIRTLRSLSVGWWKSVSTDASQKDVFQPFLAIQSGLDTQSPETTLERYAQKMRFSIPGNPGGWFEIYALSQALGFNIGVTNVNPPPELSGEESQLHPARPGVDLYLITGIVPDHYDALYIPERIPASVLSEMRDETRYYIPFNRFYEPAAVEPRIQLSKYDMDPWTDPILLLHPVAAEELAQRLPPSHHLKADIQRLQGCSIQRVYGDGHCLFRSMAILLMKESHFGVLQYRVDEFQRFMPPEIQLLHVFETTQQLLREKFVPGEIMYSRASVSKSWITFLRNLAVGWWTSVYTSSPDSTSIQTLIASEKARGNHDNDDDDTIIAQYMSTMGSYGLGSWGGEAEIVAFQVILGVNIHVIDLQTPKEQRQNGALLPENAGIADFYLLRSPNHYDALYVPGQLPAKEYDCEKTRRTAL